MHKSFQGNIVVRDGKIVTLSEGIGFVTIETDENIIRFENAWANPGFTDSHGHIAALGSKINGLNLSDALSAEECIEKSKQHKKFRSDWLTGKGWNNELWKNKKFPGKEILDDAFPDIPVHFVRVDGHAAWVNSLALKISGIDKFTLDTYGGIIERDKSGNPTGILHDNAIDLVKKQIPKYSKKQLKENIKTSLNELVKNGITCVHDMDVNPEFLEIYHELNETNEISIRIFSYVSGHNNEWLNYNVIPSFSRQLSIVGVKFYADGSLGSRSAAMLEPYTDAPNQKGIFLIDEEELLKRSTKALESGFHVAVHAIGDAANRFVLNTYRKLFEKRISDNNSVLRVEHAQHIHPKDLRLFDRYNIVASVQPVHCISDAATISEKRIGKRCEFAYPWKTLIDNGISFISGSDFPIESHNPFLAIDALTRRVPFGGVKSWFENEKLDISTAIDTNTVNPHEILKSETKNGELKKGFQADIVILNKNIYQDSEILNTHVMATIVDGKMMYNNTI
ncbi:amidohydrolase [Bacteroidota bacterium]